jgi:hypothetical protein
MRAFYFAGAPTTVMPAIGVQSMPFFKRLWAGIQYAAASAI